jgi:hypothetical protein
VEENMKIACISIACLLFSATAWAQTDVQTPGGPASPDAGQSTPSSQSAPHPGAVTYSDGYLLRARIHKVASIATLPLFGTELALGQSLYNSTSNADPKKGLHVAVGTGIIGLFGVNAVTGVWNMLEDRHNPPGHTLRLVHGILMLTANAGFVATSATGPHRRHQGIPTVSSTSNRALHRDLAFGSIGIGTVGYTLMLFGHR